MSTNDALLIGAAMPIARLADHQDWLLSGQRDLEIQDPAYAETLDGGYRALVQQARTLLDGYHGRAGIHAPFEGIALASRDPKVRAVAADRYKQALDFAVAIGATSHMVIHSPFHTFGSPFVANSVGTWRDDQIGYAHATLANILPLTEQAGMTLVIENISDANPEHLLKLVHSFNSPHVRMSLDTGHANVTSRFGGPPPDQWVRAAGDALGHVHVQDNDGHQDRHWVPGDGSIGWYGVFEALRELAHQPRLILELRDHAAIPRAMRYLSERGYGR